MKDDRFRDDAHRYGGTAPGGNLGTLEVRDLTVSYETENGNLDTVRNVSMLIKPGEIYGLVGESGSGKTTFARAVVRYLPENGSIRSGTVRLDDIEISSASKEEMRSLWGSRITMVHQNPNTSVNPSMKVGDQIAEMGMMHLGLSARPAREKAVEMLKKVRMPDPERVAQRYPHQLSGGQLQRVLIAIALSTNPSLLIMDEPTTALDVTTEAVILDMVRELLPEYRTAVLYITHNLGVVARLCNRVGVIYAGELMEEGPVRKIFKQTRHPYTLGLLGAVPRIDAGKHDVHLHTIPGYIPGPAALPPGCIFSPRCLGAREECRTTHPSVMPAGETGPEEEHLTACLRWKDLAREPELFITPQKTRELVKQEEQNAVLAVTGLKKYFSIPGGRIADLVGRKKPVVHAVDDIDIRVGRSLTMGIVGESGCGKTTLARCVAGLEKADSGEMKLEEILLPRSVSRRPPGVLRKIQMVFQNPDESLNPQHTVGYSVGRPLSLLGGMTGEEQRTRIRQLFEAVNLPESYIHRLPHELSGGEKQRVAIARAFATSPTLMICDEPISALDMSVQASLLNLLAELQDAEGTAYLFISHDLAAVRHISDWIAVIYLGRLWEVGPAADVFTPPRHPYTEALFSALPVPDPDHEETGIRLREGVPSAVDIPPGCRFHTRCPRKLGPLCETEEPPWREGGNFHRICCHIPLDELTRIQTEGDASEPGDGRIRNDVTARTEGGST